VMIGAACVSARGRFALVAGGPGSWRSELDRHGVDLLLGADLPLRLGRATLAPGLGAGVGWMHTHLDGPITSTSDTGGLRAEARAALWVPLRDRVALELALAVNVTQATHVEALAAAPVPDEPRWLAR